MRFSFAVAAFGVVSSVMALESTPSKMELVKRIPAAGGPTDVEILNYALTLEYLERDFYALGLSKFSKADFKAAGYPSYIRERFVTLSEQEATHVSFLAGALGSAAVGECKYNFGLDSVDTFLAISRILEGVGVAAYLGAAPDITSAAYLAAAGAILTIEARHSSFLNELEGLSGFPVPFETALTYSQVYSLASAFIVPGSCGGSGALPAGIHAYPKLEVKTKDPKAGHNMGLHFPIPKGYKGPYYACYLSGLNTKCVHIDMSNGVVRVPKNLAGAGTTYVIVSSSTTLDNASTIAGPAIIVL